MLASLFRLGVTSFHDGFAVTEEDATLTATEDLNEFFELLGWDMKELPSFSEQPEPLGAKFDLRRAAFGEIRVGNRPSRVDEMSATIRDVLEGGVIERKILERLRGRILHAGSLCYGRFACCALQVLNRTCSELASGTSTSRWTLTDELRTALEVLVKVMTEAPDRLVRVAYHQPVLLFTDGSFELGFSGPFAGVGGVIFVPTCKFVAYFSAEIDEELQLLTADSANRIELIAVVFAVTLWRNHLANNSVLGFVVTDAAKFALVKGLQRQPLDGRHGGGNMRC